MHVSHMRPFVPDHGLQHLARSASQQAQAYTTQRVQPIPSSDGQDPRGARQSTPQRAGTKIFGNAASAIMSFSSQLAALDLSALGDDETGAAPSDGSGDGGADELGLFQLLAKAASPSA